MSARTRARRRALELLFEAEARDCDLSELVRLRSSDPDYPMKPYAVEIVMGLQAHGEEIDEQIRTYSRAWPLERMPPVDRALSRIGAWEIMFNPEIDTPVAISEAMSLAAEYSTDDSAQFVAGLLSQIGDANS